MGKVLCRGVLGLLCIAVKRHNIVLRQRLCLVCGHVQSSCTAPHLPAVLQSTRHKEGGWAAILLLALSVWQGHSTAHQQAMASEVRLQPKILS